MFNFHPYLIISASTKIYMYIYIRNALTRTTFNGYSVDLHNVRCRCWLTIVWMWEYFVFSRCRMCVTELLYLVKCVKNAKHRNACQLFHANISISLRGYTNCRLKLQVSKFLCSLLMYIHKSLIETEKSEKIHLKLTSKSKWNHSLFAVVCSHRLMQNHL